MRRATCLLVVGSMILAACGDGESTENTGSPESTAESPGSPDPESTSTFASSAEVDPCGFLSDSEMSQILGLEVTASATGPVTCDYGPAESTGGVSLNVENVRGSGCEQVFNVAGYGSTGGEPVEGVGTYAKYGSGFVPQIAVCFDDELTLIASLGAESADPQATLVSVAQAFEANIP